MMMKLKKKDPEICEVCDMSQSDQQIEECIQSIILEQQKPMHDSHSFEDIGEKVVNDTIQKNTEQIQVDPDVFYRQ